MTNNNKKSQTRSIWGYSVQMFLTITLDLQQIFFSSFFLLLLVACLSSFPEQWGNYSSYQTSKFFSENIPTLSSIQLFPAKVTSNSNMLHSAQIPHLT